MYPRKYGYGNKKIEFYYDELIRLQNYLEKKVPVRIWYSNAPYSLCGFYHLCSILKEYESEIRVVELPKYTVYPNSIVAYQNWGEISVENFPQYLIHERKLSIKEINMYSSLWNELKEDNSLLRAVVNGEVIGVFEDFYDFLIWKNLTKEPIQEARLIGKILIKNQISIDDLWFAKRIDFYIEQGKIKVVKKSKNKYARSICLSN